ncbi:MAG: single-stranded DNA-binding protein [Solobacterium sp.]|nr:single-stranded DNA-binding protein [Solobacterium sp.]
MINNVVLVGRLTRAVDLRFTSNGVAFASFAVAVDHTFKKEGGEREADFINCVMWRKAAENFANFTRKGSLVGIEGRIQTRNYENQQGQKVYITEVLAENFSLLESRNVTEQRPNNDNPFQTGFNTGNNQNNAAGTFGNNNAPTFDNAGNYGDFNTNSNSSFGGFENNQTVNISEDDLPF